MKTIEEIKKQSRLDPIIRHGAIYIPGDAEAAGAKGLAASTSYEFFKQHLLDLNWMTKKTARHEYFMSTTPRVYSYGNAATGSQEYDSQPFTDRVDTLRQWLNRTYDTKFNVCFLNKYDDEHQHLGWHADEFPGMDASEPIFSMSYGAVREIWVKEKKGFRCPCPQCGGCGYYSTETMARYGDEPVSCPMCDGGKGGPFWQKEPPNKKQPADQRFLLGEVSIFIMPPGYQDTHLHRIPKHDRPCGWRISLTFRTFN